MNTKSKCRLICVPTILGDIGDELNPHYTLWAVCLYQDRPWKIPHTLNDDDAVIIFEEATYIYRAISGKVYMDMCYYHNGMLEDDLMRGSRYEETTI